MAKYIVYLCDHRHARIASHFAFVNLLYVVGSKSLLAPEATTDHGVSTSSSPNGATKYGIEYRSSTLPFLEALRGTTRCKAEGKRPGQIMISQKASEWRSMTTYRSSIYGPCHRC